MIALVTVSRSVVLAGFVAFLLIGALQALYGVAQFGLRTDYRVDAVTVGAFSSLLFLGSVVGILALPWLEARVGTKRALLGSSALLALGALGVSVSPSWTLALASVLVVGLGYGGVVVGFNVLFSRSFASRGAAAVNVLNAMFGIGSVLGPLVIAPLGGYRATYTVAAALSALLIALLAVSRIADGHTETSSAPVKLEPALLGFVLFFFVYVVVETGTAGSQGRHLREALGVDPQSAAGWNALFWGGLTVARLLIAPLALRVSAAPIVLGSSLLVLTALLLTHIPQFAGVAYTLAGLACGPIFPTGLVWFATYSRGNARLASLVVAAASLGGVAAPFAVAGLAGGNASAIPAALSALAAVLVCLNALTLQVTRGGQQRARLRE
jgi:fucose permease